MAMQDLSDELLARVFTRVCEPVRIAEIEPATQDLEEMLCFYNARNVCLRWRCIIDDLPARNEHVRIYHFQSAQFMAERLMLGVHHPDQVFHDGAIVPSQVRIVTLSDPYDVETGFITYPDDQDAQGQAEMEATHAAMGQALGCFMQHCENLSFVRAENTDTAQLPPGVIWPNRVAFVYNQPFDAHAYVAMDFAGRISTLDRLYALCPTKSMFDLDGISAALAARIEFLQIGARPTKANHAVETPYATWAPLARNSDVLAVLKELRIFASAYASGGAKSVLGEAGSLCPQLERLVMAFAYKFDGDDLREIFAALPITLSHLTIDVSLVGKLSNSWGELPAYHFLPEILAHLLSLLGTQQQIRRHDFSGTFIIDRVRVPQLERLERVTVVMPYELAHPRRIQATVAELQRKCKLGGIAFIVKHERPADHRYAAHPLFGND